MYAEVDPPRLVTRVDFARAIGGRFGLGLVFGCALGLFMPDSLADKSTIDKRYVTLLHYPP